MSISCSVIAHISVSHGSGLRRTRSHGRARTARPISGSSRKRAWNAAGRRRCPTAKRIRAMPSRAAASSAARAAKTVPAIGDHDRRAVDVQQPHEPVAVAPRQPVQRRRSEPERPARPHDLADAAYVQLRRSRWTSIRNEFDDTISPNGPALALLERALASGGARRRRPSRRPRRSPSRPARPPGRREPSRGGRSSTTPRLRDHGEAVDDLRRPGLLLHRRQPRSTDPTAPGGRAWCRTRDPSTAR